MRQEVMLQELGVEEIFIDIASGKDTDRLQLRKMLAFIRRGDIVIVESISRFARNTKDLLELIEALSEREVTFISKKETIDTHTPTGKFMITVFGAVAELEREYIRQRQREGIVIAKQKGKYKGRKRIESPDFDRVVARWRAGEITAVNAMESLKMSRNTFYRRVKEQIDLQIFCFILLICYNLTIA